MSYQGKKEEIDLLALQKTDETKFIEVLFKQFYTPLGRTVNRIVNDKEATEDIVQDVFVKIWNNRQTLEFTISVKSYLYRAAINAALNYLEKNKRNTSLEDGHFLEPSANQVEDHVNFIEVEARIKEGIDTLPPACKAIFVLSRYEDMSYREIAESMQISVKTVENQMGKALKQLKEYMSVYVKHLWSILL